MLSLVSPWWCDAGVVNGYFLEEEESGKVSS